MPTETTSAPASAEGKQPAVTSRMACLGCVLIISLPILLVVAVGSFVKYRENRIVNARGSLPRHRVPFAHLKEIPDGEPYIKGELIVVEAFLADAGMSIGFPRFIISSRQDRSDGIYVDIPACRKQRTRNCYSVQWISDREYSSVLVVGDSGSSIASGSKVLIEGVLDVFEVNDNSMQTGPRTSLEITRIAGAPGDAAPR